LCCDCYYEEEALQFYKFERISRGGVYYPFAMDPASIDSFFVKCTRDNNDATNKVREAVLSILLKLDASYIEHIDYGEKWSIVSSAWLQALKDIAITSEVPPYTSITTETKAGRGYNYDIEVNYFNAGVPVAVRHVEFKYGCKKIDKLPQFLSLQAKFPMFSKTYDVYFYESFLDAYLACDDELAKMAKPSLDEYVKMVTATSSTHPFFATLKLRETINKVAKASVVNKSIRSYLDSYGATLNMASFHEKVKTSQTGKLYLLWQNGVFHHDSIALDGLEQLALSGIKNGNVLMVKSGNTTYKLLLRWRNHKGILNPAWQISLDRC
jgi:hypothetical protein